MCAENFSVPEPVLLENLRTHFHDAYRFNASQVEIMVQSSSKSLCQAMADIEEFLLTGKGYRLLCSVFHNLKGVSLNMGEDEWADFFRTIEKRIDSGEPCDIEKIRGTMIFGLKDVLSAGVEATSDL